MSLKIYNARHNVLTENQISEIVQIEFHPQTRKWLMEKLERQFEDAFMAYKQFFEGLPQKPEVEILIASWNEKIVGFLGLWTLRRGKGRGGRASIGVSVHPEYRQKNVATQLVLRAIEIAQEKDLKKLKIETLAENIAMRRTAEKAGFTYEKLRKRKVHDELRDEVVYFKEI